MTAPHQDNPGGDVLVYEAPDGTARVDVRLEHDTVWLSLTQMADLFERDKSVISRHLRNVFASGELDRVATAAKNATVQREGGREVRREVGYFKLTSPENVLMHPKNVFGDREMEEAATAKDFLVVRTEGKRRVRRAVKHYSLDAIISVGYCVNSRRGVGFRQWATGTLRDHLVCGYTLSRQGFEENAAEPEAALALLVAESDPKDKGVMVRLVMNMLAGAMA